MVTHMSNSSVKYERNYFDTEIFFLRVVVTRNIFIIQERKKKLKSHHLS